MFVHGGKADMSKSVVFLCVFDRSKGGNGEKLCVFVCFLGKVEKCRVFVCFWFVGAFARSKGGNVEKCRVFVCFWFLLVFAWSKREMSKSVVCVKKCRVFVCFLGKVSCWGPRLECTTYYIIYIYI